MENTNEETMIEIIPDTSEKVYDKEIVNKASDSSQDLTSLNTKPSSTFVSSSNSSVSVRGRASSSIQLQKDKAAKRDKLRFFYPSEWYKFYSILDGDKKFFYEFLINTGMRYNEASKVKVRDINLNRKNIVVMKAKNDKQRRIFISSQLVFSINQWCAKHNLGPDDTLGFPSLQYADKYVKKIAQKAGIADYQNITTHTFRKTLENYLIALGVNTMNITMQLGHTVDVAVAFYTAQFFKTEEKALIRGIIGDLLQ